MARRTGFRHQRGNTHESSTLLLGTMKKYVITINLIGEKVICLVKNLEDVDVGKFKESVKPSKYLTLVDKKLTEFK